MYLSKEILKVMLLMNEKGSTILFGMIIVMIFTSLSLLFIKKRMNRITIIKEKQQLHLCTKEANGLSQKFVKLINKTNHWLKVATITKYLSIIVPVLNTAGSISTKSAIKSLKIVQRLKTISYLKKIRDLHTSKCSFDISIYTTPLRFSRFSIKRNSYNQAIFRGTKWTYHVYSPQEVTKNTITNIGVVSSSLRKRANFLWRPLYSP
jgi:hypothetical protein